MQFRNVNSTYRLPTVLTKQKAIEKKPGATKNEGDGGGEFPG